MPDSLKHCTVSENDLGTPLADRSVDLIAKASKAGGDISEVLRAAAKDTFEVVNLGSGTEQQHADLCDHRARFICRIPVRHCNSGINIPDHNGNRRCFRHQSAGARGFDGNG